MVLKRDKPGGGTPPSKTTKDKEGKVVFYVFHAVQMWMKAVYNVKVVLSGSTVNVLE